MSLATKLGRLSLAALIVWLVVGTGIWVLGGPTRGAALEAAVALVLGATLLIWWTSARLDPASARWPLVVGIHALAALVFGSLMVTVTYSLEASATGVSLSQAAASARFLGGEFVFWTWLYAVLGVGSFGLRLRESLGRQRELASHAEARLAEAHLELLRGQLNPHFLFNALHGVSALVAEDPALAQEALEQLGDLLRYSLDEPGADRVPLGEELRFTMTYLGLVDMALGERARVAVECDDAALADLVPPFSVQTLVENAVRHGVEPHPEGGTVDVRIRGRDGVVEVVVENDRTSEGRDIGAGVGLENLRERLSAMYGGEASLEAGPSGSGGFRARLVLPAA